MKLLMNAMDEYDQLMVLEDEKLEGLQAGAHRKSQYFFLFRKNIRCISTDRTLIRRTRFSTRSSISNARRILRQCIVLAILV